ncbi:MAG: ribonuclease III [Candidatus Krumholzibacteriota bacterium]|nr:ribonuclease III [Candidatus Krumholzibacteriota bacterium]
MRSIFGGLRGIFRKEPETGPQHLELLEQKIGYTFSKKVLLVEALTHRSVLGELKPGEEGITYERLEFLGDSVLALVTTHYLLRNFPEEDEGQLTKKKSLLVSKNVLTKMADSINLKDHVILSENAFKGGVHSKDSIQTAVLEAVIGAIYLDGGLEPARDFIEELVLSDIDEILDHTDHINYKSHLQEWTQSKYRGYPKYRVKSTTGPEHDKMFLVEVRVSGGVVGKGRGKSKKDAEQIAAKEALSKLRKSR